MRKKDDKVKAAIQAAFTPTDTYSVSIDSKGAFYPSDQRNFVRGIGVAALNKTKRGLLYMNKIHTKRDTVYDEENIEFLKNGAIEMTRILSNQNTW